MSANPKNLGPKQRAEVQRQIARAYRAWRKRYGEPTPKEREAIVAIGFKEARKKLPSIPTAANPSLVSAAIGGATGALIANALGNPEGAPVSPGEYRKLKDRNTAYERARESFDPKRYKRGGGYTPADIQKIEQAAGGKAPTNEERAEIELYEFVHDPPEKYFAYYDKALTKIKNWTGLTLGDIVRRGSEYRSPMGDRRVNVTVRGINGRLYTGTCFLSAGDYCRLKAAKSPRLNPLTRGEQARVQDVADQFMTEGSVAAYQGVQSAVDQIDGRNARQLGHVLDRVRPNPLLMTVMGANPGGGLKDALYSHLRRKFSPEDVSDFDIEAAIYWFASDYHGGQGSELYRVLSESKFEPGPSHRSVDDEGETARWAFSELVSKFRPPGTNPEGRKSHQITRDDIVRAVRSLTHPGTPEEIETLVREHEGKYYKGHPYEMQSMIVGSLVELRRRGGHWDNPYAGGPVVDESPRIARLRNIAASEIDTEFEGVLLDPMSASVLVQVHDALPYASRARFARLPLPRMGSVAMQAMMRRSANPLNRKEFDSLFHHARRLREIAGSYRERGYGKGVFEGRADQAELDARVYARREGGWVPPERENPRAVHESIVSAFFDRQNRRIGERYSTDGQALRVWGNLVAEWRPEGLYITDAGWRTLLTRNVLNQILVEAFRRGRPSGQIFQKKFDWYFEPITQPEGRRLKPISWTGGMVVGTTAVAPVMVPAANPGICPPLCMNPMHEHKPKARRISARKVYRAHVRAPLKAAANPARRGRKVTMTLEEFARKVKATKNPKLWQDFLAKIRGYKKWSHGTLPKRVTVESVPGAPGMKGIMLTYDAGKAPESTYIMPGGTKRKGAWKHPWSKMPAIKHDPEAGLVIHKVGRGQVTDFYHR